MPATRQVHSRTSAARLDSVEIKVTLGTAQAGKAIRVLGLPPQNVERQIYFCEDLRAAGPFPLLTSGVILRLRHTAGDDDESTVKLRPCRRSRLTPRWLDLHKQGRHEFRLESDWSGERKVLAASLVAKRDEGIINDVFDGREPLRRAFTDTQREFLAECADTEVSLDTLTVLGPIPAIKWPRVDWHGFDVATERWTLPEHPADAAVDFLELSLRVEPQGAEVVQASFDALLRDHELDPDSVQETKTQLVLEHLARRRR